jgi:hypothetical protein
MAKKKIGPQIDLDLAEELETWRRQEKLQQGHALEMGLLLLLEAPDTLRKYARSGDRTSVSEWFAACQECPDMIRNDPGRPEAKLHARDRRASGSK